MRIISRFDNEMVQFGIRQLADIPCEQHLILYLPEEADDSVDLPADMEDQAYFLLNSAEGLKLFGKPQGLMYGMIDLAEALRSVYALPVGYHEPYLKERGIKFNIPLDARTPSYSDASNSAWNNIPVMWEMSFWTELIDFLAIHKYNVVSLWNLNPFPSMVITPGFERVALANVMRTHDPVYGATTRALGMYTRNHRESLSIVRVMSMEEKIHFWRDVMQYGANRGVQFLIFTWNIFVYGTEDAGYDITDKMDNPVTKEYVRSSVEALIDTYPLLAGIGVTAGEMMSSGRGEPSDELADESWLMETYGEGINAALAKNPGRTFRFIHRQHMTGASSIENAFCKLSTPVEFSFKYSQAHMYSDPHPHFADAFYQSLRTGQKTWLTLRNDDLYLLRWGGVAYAREYLKGIPNEQTIGFMMGPDGYTIGRDFAPKAEEFNGQIILRHQWYQTAIWGRLAFDPDIQDSHFISVIQHYTDCTHQQAEQLFRLSEELSWVLPLVNQVHWHDFDFQNYPEANLGLDWYHAAGGLSTGLLWHGIHDFLLAPAQPGGMSLSVKETAGYEKKELSVPDGKRSVTDTVSELFRHVQEARNTISDISYENTSAEYCDYIADCHAMIMLGEFYVHQIQCALTVQRAIVGAPNEGYDYAVSESEKAAAVYECYAKHMAQRFKVQRLSRMNGRAVDFIQMSAAAHGDIQNVIMLMRPYR